MDTVRFFIFYNFFRSEQLQQKERNSCNAEIRQTKQRKPFTRRKQPCWKKTDERNSRAAGNMPAFFLLSIGAPIYVTIQKINPIANSGMLKIQSVMSKVPPAAAIISFIITRPH